MLILVILGAIATLMLVMWGTIAVFTAIGYGIQRLVRSSRTKRYRKEAGLDG